MTFGIGTNSPLTNHTLTVNGSSAFQGNLSASRHLFASCSENSSVSNVALYDTDTGKFFYTASNAIGGGGGGSIGTLQTVTDNGSITNNPITSSANIALSASGDIIANDFRVPSQGKYYFDQDNGIPNNYMSMGGGNQIEIFRNGSQRFSIQANNTLILSDTRITGDITSSGNITASGDVIANKYEANPGGPSGYNINSTSSINSKDFGVYFANSQNWSNITVGVSTALAPSQEITLGSANVSLAGVNTAGSVNTGTNVLTIDSGTGRIHMTGSYGGSNSLAFQKIKLGTTNISNTPIDALIFNDNAFSMTAVSSGVLNDVTVGFDYFSGTTNNGLMTFDSSGTSGTVESNFTFDGTTAFINGALRVGSNAAANTTNGKIVASNDVVAFATSDERLKKYIKPIPNALDKVSQIRGIEFDWKVTDEKMRKEVHSFEGHDVGVLAQEVEKVLPEVVVTRDSGYKAVRYEKIVPLLIESIKELKAEIEELKKSK
jgi:hypothetical protein